ncbi:MAG: hypothetical protein H6595_14005 [Flavobacteriales bacterium]|nr:hypothetical protein [Flavobacteriales bacterium]MCB9168580.1 hypothetical protein [Flavobacteriales bacterium]
MGDRLHVICFAVIGALALVACNGSRSLAKKAGKLDQAGLYTEAADMYLQSLQRDQRNVDAKIGLKKVGQQVLDDKLGGFFKVNSLGEDLGGAVDAYLQAKSYAERAGKLGVQLDIADHYKSDFEQVKGAYLVELYTRGQEQMAGQRFQEAERTFERIAQIEPDYKDASSLQSIAYLEPLYRSAKNALDVGQYRKAYEDLTKVLAKDRAYKDAAGLQQEALRKGQYSIAVLPFERGRIKVRKSGLEGTLQAYAIAALTNSSDPFLRVVDRDNMQRILDEQRLGLSGVVDQETAVQVGNLIGAQAVLMGEVLQYEEVQGDLRTSTKKGYEAYQVKQKNAETGGYDLVTRYRPATYTEYYREDRVDLSVNYKLVSLETGEVLFAKVVDDQRSASVHYADYQGNKDALMPSANGTVDLSNGARSTLRSLLGAGRTITPMGELSTELLRSTGSTIAAQVQQELAGKLP